MRLTIKHDEDFGDGDWYRIVRAEHENRQGIVPVGPGMAHWYDSARIGDACVEGTGEEMRAIAEAIKTRDSISFRRCAAYYRNDGYEFSSPRNTTDCGPTIPLKDCEDLAELILGTVPETPPAETPSTEEETMNDDETRTMVYVAYVVRPGNDQREEDSSNTILGVYTDRTQAEAALWRRQQAHSFHLRADIHECYLDREGEPCNA